MSPYATPVYSSWMRREIRGRPVRITAEPAAGIISVTTGGSTSGPV